MSNDLDRARELLSCLDCVHCGLCLEHCPTYIETGRESAGPRGRVYLLRALLEERVQPEPELLSDLDSCLLCRACESACPSGVRFAEILSSARTRLRKRGPGRRYLMDRVLVHPQRLRRLALILRVAQGTGLVRLAAHLPGRLGRLAACLPPLPPSSQWSPLPAYTPPRGKSRGRVALLQGCVMPLLFPDVGKASLRLLSQAGYEVVVPPDAGCCGALHLHDGALPEARRLALFNLEAFSGVGLEAILSNSAGCGAALREYDRLLEDPRAGGLSSRVMSVCRFLLDKGGILPLKPLPVRAVVDTPCHLQHGLGEGDAPLKLLNLIPGFMATPLDTAAPCCGAAGLYSFDQPAMSETLLDEKIKAFKKHGSSLLVTANPGCLMQWRRGLRRRRIDAVVRHPLSLLAEAL